ncbi:MAG TPA: nucleoside-diphosphate kinase [Candidatus Paceibacterota bacterium]
MNHPKEEQTLVLLKPDALQRNLLGEIIHRFERKGLKIIGLKMLHMDEVLMKEHYGKYSDKPFFEGLKKYMSASPLVAMVISGIGAVGTVRTIVGPTRGSEAPGGTIRGDFAMSIQSNLIHASDPAEDPKEEIARFFKSHELFSYQRIDFETVYSDEERN